MPAIPKNSYLSNFTKRKSLFRRKKKRKVFDRLFDDFTEREDRLDELKNHLEKLESMHWEEILTILNLY